MNTALNTGEQQKHVDILWVPNQTIAPFDDREHTEKRLRHAAFLVDEGMLAMSGTVVATGMHADDGKTYRIMDSRGESPTLIATHYMHKSSAVKNGQPHDHTTHDSTLQQIINLEEVLREKAIIPLETEHNPSIGIVSMPAHARRAAKVLEHLLGHRFSEIVLFPMPENESAGARFHEFAKYTVYRTTFIGVKREVAALKAREARYQRIAKIITKSQ